jgi:hypothetical protein
VCFVIPYLVHAPFEFKFTVANIKEVKEPGLFWVFGRELLAILLFRLKASG